MSEVEEKQINEKTEKAKKAKNRTSLKNIIGGDILATDFFRRQTKLIVHFLNNRNLSSENHRSSISFLLPMM